VHKHKIPWGVTRVDALPVAAVVAQIQTVVEDIAVQAVKTGMLLNQEIITAVAEQIEALRIITSGRSCNGIANRCTVD